MACVKRRFSRVICVCLWGLALALTSAGCAFDQARETGVPFKNNYTGSVDRPLPDLFRWIWSAWRDGLPKPPSQPVPVQLPDLAAIVSNSAPASAMQPAITWIGHATMLVQAGGLNVLTDPMFSERASPVQLAGPKRAQPPGVALHDLPPIDVVVISHNHYDHLDRHSVVALNQQNKGATIFLVPLGLKAWMADLGIDNVIELGWWQGIGVSRTAQGKPAVVPERQGVAFFLTPVQHWSVRGLTDKNRTLWGGWAVFAPDFHWYYSGDTGYSKDFVDTRQHFSERNKRPDGRDHGFDLALLPVGAYEPRWFMKEQHVNPAEAVQIHKDLGARRSVGVHWGTFELTDEPLDQPPKDLEVARSAAGLSGEDFFVLRIGETRRFPRR